MVRFLIFLLSAFLLGVLQSTLVSLIFPAFLKPDLMILLVVFLGLSFPLLPGALLTLFSGLLYDTFSGQSLGLFPVIYLLIFFVLKLLQTFLILGEALPFRMVLVALLMGFQVLLLIFLPLAVGAVTEPFWPLPGWILPQVLATCAACWPLFYLFRRLDVPPMEDMAASME